MRLFLVISERKWPPCFPTFIFFLPGIILTLPIHFCWSYWHIDIYIYIFLVSSSFCNHSFSHHVCVIASFLTPYNIIVFCMWWGITSGFCCKFTCFIDAWPDGPKLATDIFSVCVWSILKTLHCQKLNWVCSELDTCLLQTDDADQQVCWGEWF